MIQPTVKLCALPMINQLAVTRDVLLGKLNDLNQDKFSIVINGRESEDCEFKKRAKPLLKQIVQERIASIEHDLTEFGVDPLA